jgi:hypothetical protein
MSINAPFFIGKIKLANGDVLLNAGAKIDARRASRRRAPKRLIWWNLRLQFQGCTVFHEQQTELCRRSTLNIHLRDKLRRAHVRFHLMCD